MARLWSAVVLGLAWVAWPVGWAHAEKPADAGRPTMSLVVLGDSLAAGYGVDPAEAFPAVLQQWIREAGYPFEVVPAAVSGDTTAGGLRRLGWILRRPMDVLLLELGGNDGLRGLSPSMTRSNLLAIVRQARERHPGLRVVLAGMQMPPNMGEAYLEEFRRVYPGVAEETGASLIPHLLEGVGGQPEFNLPDLIHPTPEGHRRVASNCWVVLRPVLEAAVRGR